MNDAITASEFEHRLPAAYSQGFAHVRVLVLPIAEEETPLAASPAPDATFLGTSLPAARAGLAPG